ncbi:hypothetical protein [Cellulomonas hominis]|uniref:hypothetical protein n=1 Tax=Cellulomonas hominis TaxID=156981 RepID=UPI001B90A786|nr:hypothetical protein [Cellulomonas hominis]VTR77628.1 hypothetical protein CHMI_02399 [Cellulomonas hominis]
MTGTLEAVGQGAAVAHGALLQAVGGLAGAAEPSPSPSTVEVPSADQTSPGLLGFLVTFGVAVAVILLAFSLVRHLRVVDRNARRLEAEGDGPAPRPAAPTGDATPGTDGPGESGTPPRDRP